MRELAFDLLILLVAVGAQAPVALGAVFFAQSAAGSKPRFGGAAGRDGGAASADGHGMAPNSVMKPVCRNFAVPRQLRMRESDAIRAITPSHRQISAVSAITYPSHCHHVASHLIGPEKVAL